VEQLSSVNPEFGMVFSFFCLGAFEGFERPEIRGLNCSVCSVIQKRGKYFPKVVYNEVGLVFSRRVILLFSVNKDLKLHRPHQKYLRQY